MRCLNDSSMNVPDLEEPTLQLVRSLVFAAAVTAISGRMQRDVGRTEVPDFEPTRSIAPAAS